MGQVAGLAAIKVCAGSGSVGRAGGIYVPATIRRRSETEAGVQEREGTTEARDEAVDVGGREEERERKVSGDGEGRDERARSSRGLVEWIHFRNLQKRRRCSASPNDSNFAGPRAASRVHWPSLSFTAFYWQTRALTGNFLGRPFSFTYFRNSSPRLCIQTSPSSALSTILSDGTRAVQRFGVLRRHRHARHTPPPAARLQDRMDHGGVHFCAVPPCPHAALELSTAGRRLTELNPALLSGRLCAGRPTIFRRSSPRYHPSPRIIERAVLLQERVDNSLDLPPPDISSP